MTAAVNLKRARIIEVGAPEQNGILIRAKPGDPFTRIGGVGEGEVEVDETGCKLYEDEPSVSRLDITVLAEFPVTLADLIPEGCEAFRFESHGDTHRVAMRRPRGQWEVTGMHGVWADLNELAFDAAVDLSTVVPLTVHPDWIEAQR